MLKKKDRMRTFCLLLKPETIELIKGHSEKGKRPHRWFIEEAIDCYLSTGSCVKYKVKKVERIETKEEAIEKREIKL